MTFAIALRTARTYYDSVYLTLALEQDCPLVTADRRFYNALQHGPFKRYVAWVEDDL